MLTSLAYIFLFGLGCAAIVQFLKLPRIIGMLITGVVLGPFALNLLDQSILDISGELRTLALVIILIKAGLSLNLDDLKKVGRPAILLSFLPASFEILAYVLFAPYILHINLIEAAIMGAVLGAVSPAVVVPKMVQLMDEHYGTDKQVPQMILAGASLDDVYVIVLFTTFVSIAQGAQANFKDFLNIPVSIVLGILLGLLAGFILARFFEKNFYYGHKIRNSMKVIIVLSTAFILLAVEDWCKPYVSVSGMLAVLTMALAVAMKSVSSVVTRLQQKFGKLWIAAEVILFVLVGAAVDISYVGQAGLAAIAMILLGLLIRSIGVWISLLGTRLNNKERLFCTIAYLPKATVQAAIGAVPLTLGLPCGQIVLTVSVLSILMAAPMGAIGMDMSYKPLLKQENKLA